MTIHIHGLGHAEGHDIELHENHHGGLGVGSFVTDLLFHGTGPGSQHPDVDALHEFLGVPSDFHPPCVVTEPLALVMFAAGMIGLGGFHWLFRS